MEMWLASSTLLGLVLGGAITFFTTRAQLRIEASHAYDRSLRDLRLSHYQALFHLTEVLPREWGATGPPQRGELIATRERFHAWYFSESAGGMFLSQSSRQAYFALQNDLQTAARSIADNSGVVGEPHSSTLRVRASGLRHQLAADLGVAEKPRRRWISPRSIPPPEN
jgi:hypothetical protein